MYILAFHELFDELVNGITTTWAMSSLQVSFHLFVDFESMGHSRMAMGKRHKGKNEAGGSYFVMEVMRV
jgi:hypothetical protein